MPTPTHRASTRTMTAILIALAAGMGGCEVTKTQEGKMPEVEVREGQMPKYDVDGPEVDVQMKKKEVEVPDVDVDVHSEKKLVDVPDIDVKMPSEDNDTPAE